MLIGDNIIKLNQIIVFSLFAFFLSVFLYPILITVLKKYKIGKNIRENSSTGENATIFQKLHQHKAGTPNIGGAMFLFIMFLMIIGSYFLQDMGLIKYTLRNSRETKIILFGFFSMGLLGLLDDIINIIGKNKIKGLSAKAKLFGMFLFSAFISWWFYVKLGVDTINLWPIAGEIKIGIFYPILTFFLTISIVNAINITDGLDGLAGGLMSIVLLVLTIITFSSHTYIATATLGILIATLCAFMIFNIYPAKIFMGEAGALGLGGFLSSLLYLLNIKMGIFIPFTILFMIFIVEVSSSGIQIFYKKFFKKKLFSIAPLHHFLENRGIHETTIVMKAWLIQSILAAIALILITYQMI